MARLAIVRIGHEALRKTGAHLPEHECKDPALKRFLKDMVDTMHYAKGVGLAANQVGVSKQVIVLECSIKDRYPDEEDVPLQMYINPKILKYSKETEDDWEGCLSIPGYRGLVPRSHTVTFEALTPNGEKVKHTVSGFHARIMQHEIDHINGLFYIDRMRDLKSWFHLDEFNKRFGTDVADQS